MSGSFGKRARALIMFAGLVPITATQAQTLPSCEFSQKISKYTLTTGKLYTQDSDPALRGDFRMEVEANKVKPNRKALLTSPTAKLSWGYQWGPGGTMTSYDFSVRNPYEAEDGQTGPAYVSVLTVDGSSQSLTMTTSGTDSWNTLYDRSAVDRLGTLKKDITLVMGHPDGDPEKGPEYTFTFGKGDISKAYRSANGQFTALVKKAQAGQCQPAHFSSSSGGSGSACFLTTATCEAVGLADDCWELRTLRKFRDSWLADQPGGMDDIQAYYAKAPAIAERLKQDPHALLRLYWTRIVPSALAAQVGANGLARAIYSKGMRELAAA